MDSIVLKHLALLRPFVVSAYLSKDISVAAEKVFALFKPP